MVESRGSVYDPYKRDPLFTRAEVTGMWELCALASHMHPSVRKQARKASYWLLSKSVQFSHHDDGDACLVSDEEEKSRMLF